MSYMLYKGSFAASLRTDPSVSMSMYMQAILLPRAGCVKLAWQTVYIFVNGAMIHAWACSKEARKGTYSYRDCRPRTTSAIAADNVACVTSWSLFHSTLLQPCHATSLYLLATSCLVICEGNSFVFPRVS